MLQNMQPAVTIRTSLCYTMWSSATKYSLSVALSLNRLDTPELETLV